MHATEIQFDEIIKEFYMEMDTATPERAVEILDIIDILVEEKANRGF